MPTKKKLPIKSAVRVNAYSVIASAVELALSPIRLERFFKYYSSAPSQEHLMVISEKAADAVMMELCEVLTFDD